jgi:cytohesin
MPKPEVIRLLLAAGADPNAVDFEGATPLMYAAKVERPEVLRALLAAGADPDAQDAQGRTALMYAADHCQTESVRLLVQAGADVMLKDSNGYTALRVPRNISKFRRRSCGASEKQIVHILQVAHISR